MRDTPFLGQLPLLTFRRRLLLTVWDDGVRERLMAYWRTRDFVFVETEGDYLSAKRGTLWGNLTSYDSKRLLAALSIVRANPAEVVVTMDVDTRFQIILPWNRRYFELEMETMESFLWRNDSKEKMWAEFYRDSNRSFILWTLTCGLLGNDLPPRWQTVDEISSSRL